jgi:hypothetical protein
MTNVKLLTETMNVVELGAKIDLWQQSSYASLVDARPIVTGVEPADEITDLMTFEVEAKGDMWSCRTTGCFAGFAAVLAGAKPLLDVVDGYPYLMDGWVTTPAGSRESVHAFAQEVLGITDPEAMALFSGTNSIEDLRECVAQLIEES